MEKLRHPQNGCPWTLAQNFATIAPYTLEEVYETLEAIEKGDKAHLCEELGDLLFQIVFYAQMAQEEKSFTFEDIIEKICTKMIRRHPHIFLENAPKKQTIAQLKEQWQKIKQQEQQEKAKAGIEKATYYLDDIKRALPPIEEALKLQDKAAQIGFDWSEAAPILAKIKEEQEELEEAMHSGEEEAIEEEFGDLLFTVLNYARHLKINPNKALKRTNEKFRQRFSYIEDKLNSCHTSLKEASLEDMENLWQEAKKK